MTHNFYPACLQIGCLHSPFPGFHNWLEQLTEPIKHPNLTLSCQFLSNLLFLCLKSIKAVCFGHFVGTISMRPCCSPFKLFLFLLLICPVLISLLVQLQELMRCRVGGSSSSLTGVQIAQYVDVFANPEAPHMYYSDFYETSSHSKVMLKILEARLQ